jgi:hypothetical protein
VKVGQEIGVEGEEVPVTARAASQYFAQIQHNSETVFAAKVPFFQMFIDSFFY